MGKLSTREVPCLSNLDQKRIRVNYSKALLERFKRSESDFSASVRNCSCAFEEEESIFQNNASFYTSTVAMAKIYELHFKLVDHTSYSPDLTVSSYSFMYFSCFMFSNLKVSLEVQRFLSDREVIIYENTYFVLEKDVNYYL